MFNVPNAQENFEGGGARRYFEPPAFLASGLGGVRFRMYKTYMIFDYLGKCMYYTHIYKYMIYTLCIDTDMIPQFLQILPPKKISPKSSPKNSSSSASWLRYPWLKPKTRCLSPVAPSPRRAPCRHIAGLGPRGSPRRKLRIGSVMHLMQVKRSWNIWKP